MLIFATLSMLPLTLKCYVTFIQISGSQTRVISTPQYCLDKEMNFILFHFFCIKLLFFYFIFRELMTHENVTFNDNNTVSTNPSHPLVWQEHLSEGRREDDEVVMLNIAMLVS